MKLDLDKFNRLFRYDPETGEISYKTDGGQKNFGGRKVRAGDLATYRDKIGCLRVSLVKKGININYEARRVAWLLYKGEDPGPFKVVGINCDLTDNRFKNLRLK